MEGKAVDKAEKLPSWDNIMKSEEDHDEWAFGQRGFIDSNIQVDKFSKEIA